MKRIIIACDGTWQDLETSFPTNVVKFVQAVLPTDSQGISQIVHYDSGVGSKESGLPLLGGGFGYGLDKDILEAYRFLALNWCEGDEIYMVGFSRGAYTVRSLCGLIRNSGLVKRNQIRHIPRAYELYRDKLIGVDSFECIQFRETFSQANVNITALCCFDTVGALGVPNLSSAIGLDKFFASKYRFHDTQLSKIVQNAFHAMALDERRKVFIPTPMQASPNNPKQTLNQVWFVGDHGAIGGGSAEKNGLADVSLCWMFDAIKKAGLGLEVNPKLITGGLNPNWMLDFAEDDDLLSMLGTDDRKLIKDPTDLHCSAVRRWHGDQNYRPGILADYQNNLENMAQNVNCPCT